MADLGTALGLSAVVGLERELRLKDAGLRTNTLVGLGSALFMLVSKFGFDDLLKSGVIVLDPSRVAAQIVSGVGFLGAGLIFVRRDAVRGLTTAAAVWVTAAIGAAAGAGLLVLATLTTAMYFIVTLLLPLARRHLRLPNPGTSTLRVRYPDGQGMLRTILNEATQRGYTIDDLSAETASDVESSTVTVTMHVHGRRPVSELATVLTDLDLVSAVVASDRHGADE